MSNANQAIPYPPPNPETRLPTLDILQDTNLRTRRFTIFPNVQKLGEKPSVFYLTEWPTIFKEDTTTPTGRYHKDSFSHVSSFPNFNMALLSVTEFGSPKKQSDPSVKGKYPAEFHLEPKKGNISRLNELHGMLKEYLDKGLRIH